MGRARPRAASACWWASRTWIRLVAKGTPIDLSRGARNHHRLRRHPHLPHAARAALHGPDLAQRKSGSRRRRDRDAWWRPMASIRRRAASIGRWCATARSSPTTRWAPWLEGNAGAAAQGGRVGRTCRRSSSCRTKRRTRSARGAPPPGRAHLRPAWKRQPVITDGNVQDIDHARGQPRRAPDRRLHDRRQRSDGADAARGRRLLHPPRGEGARALAAHRGTGRAATATSCRPSPIPAR